METTSDPWKQLSEETASEAKRIEQQQQTALTELEEQWRKHVESVLATMNSDTDRLGENARKHLSAIEVTLLRDVATSQKRLVWVATRGLLIATMALPLLAVADFWLGRRAAARWDEYQVAQRALGELPQITVVNGKRYIKVSPSGAVQGKKGMGKPGVFYVPAKVEDDGKSYYVELE